MYILGISCFYHDSAVALVQNGSLIFAAEEERFTRRKHDNVFPSNAIKKALQCASIQMSDVSEVVFYEKPLRKLERILEDYAATYPSSLKGFVTSFPTWLNAKSDIVGNLKKEFGYTGAVSYATHHESHAAAAFYTSSFAEAAVVTIDGVGESETTCIWQGTSDGLQQLATITYPHSLGLLYSAITAYLGFKVNDEEYKVMALAAYGDASKVPQMEQLITLHGDGSFVLSMEFFSFQGGGRMWSSQLEKLLGAPRKSSEPIEESHKDIAAGLQRILEKTVLAIVERAFVLTGSKNICLGGGVALNAVANGLVCSNGTFENMHIWGAAGDSGAAAGCALLRDGRRGQLTRLKQSSLLLGTEYTEIEIDLAIEQSGLRALKLPQDEVAPVVAELLSNGKVVARFEGKMEFGPRALGNRSLLAHPTLQAPLDRLQHIKAREAFRPYGAICFEERLSEYVQVPDVLTRFPYMNVCLPVIESAKQFLTSVTHVDGSCRIQTVERNAGNEMSELLTQFEQLTGIGALLNTSFNRRGEPLVETPAQAIATFKDMEIDHLLIGTRLLSH